MSMIKCSECKKEISSKAEKCPHCGKSTTVNRLLLKVKTKFKNLFTKFPLQKYITNKSALVLLVLLIAVCLIVYGFLSYSSNLQTSGVVTVNAAELTVINTWRDILLVIVSTLSIDLVVSLIMTVRSKNKVLFDFFVEDVISSPDFYNRLSDEERRNMLTALEMAEYYDDKKTLQKLHRRIGEKLGKNHSNDDYYYEKCEYTVKIEEKDDYFENTVIRSIDVRSYAKTTEVYNFRLATVDNYGGLSDYYVIQELSINNESKELDRIHKESKTNDDLIETRNGYLDTTEYTLKDKLVLRDDEDTNIYVIVKTRSNKNDLSSAFRTSVPCKKLIVDYQLLNTGTYNKVIARAFGSMEDASTLPNIYGDSGVKLQLKDWVLKDNGIVVHAVRE